MLMPAKIWNLKGVKILKTLGFWKPKDVNGSKIPSGSLFTGFVGSRSL